MDINSRIRTLRKELGLKQYEFANSIGLKNGAISWMEKTGNTVTEQNIEMICAKFNVNKTWLLTGEGTMFTEEKEKTDLMLWAERLSAEGDTFAYRLAVCLSKLSQEQLDTLAEIAEQLVAEDNRPRRKQHECLSDSPAKISTSYETTSESVLMVAEHRE